MRNFKIIVPYGKGLQELDSLEVVGSVEKVCKLEVKDGKLKIAKLILTLDSFEKVSGTRYNASFLKPDGSKCYYKNFFIEQIDLEKWIKSKQILDCRKSNQRMEVDYAIEQD